MGAKRVVLVSRGARDYFLRTTASPELGRPPMPSELLRVREALREAVVVGNGFFKGGCDPDRQEITTVYAVVTETKGEREYLTQEVPEEIGIVQKAFPDGVYKTRGAN